ncbi:sensor histidine kinase [Marinobacterium nitratireducens]|uniref:histidine kinase n=1 Tax=Marinobacterium nitratireducens TaxID=518897 RepID=A0A918DTD0_9GAMM|nr:sensor histidine kinase [Marinobacterium nitratireducens]GGO81928.1 sensor histidine kinase [Marinobacterium nitratireducens]
MSTTKRGYSLRRRLLSRTALLLVAVLLLLSLGAWRYARQAADYSYDRLLNSASLSIMEGLLVRNGRVDLDLPYAALEMMQLAPDDKVFYQVRNPQGEWITGYDDLPQPETFEPSDKPFFYDARYRGEPLRFVIQSKRLTEPAVSGWVQVTLGQTLNARRELMVDILYKALLALLGLMLLALAALWFGINRALDPLSLISRTLKQRSAGDTEPLAQTPIQEVSPLVDAINSYHRRLLDNLEAMKTFIADASHQIRTAQSATQAQLDIASQTNDPATLPQRLDTIRQQHLQLTRLTNQLLAHAMVVHRSDTQSLEPIDIDALLKQLLTECVRDHAHRDIDFAYHCDLPHCSLPADRVSLREAVRNLLDNAVRYGPDDNQIDLQLVAAANGGLDIIVDDRGTGIAPHLRRQALQRFSRLATEASGSGLGLSIVQSVAEAHGGDLFLENSPLGGLRARLHLPGGST